MIEIENYLKKIKKPISFEKILEKAQMLGEVDANELKELIDNNNLEQISMNTMHSTDGNITNSNDNYLTIMTNNINELKKELYK